MPLDNTTNSRPDWREYDPIRRFLLANIDKLRDDVFYGFFSPRFGEKTQTDSIRVMDFISRNAGVDLIDFSREGFNQSVFLNTFVQGDRYHSGLLDGAQEVFSAIGIDADLSQLVMDTACSPYSNHFVAKPRFWKRWFEIAEQVFALAEGQGKLARLLSGNTTYNSRRRFSIDIVVTELPAKVFIIERLASLILALESSWQCVAYQPFNPLDADGALVKPTQIAFAMRCDSLKSCYRKAPSPEYKREYNELLEGQPWHRKWV